MLLELKDCSYGYSDDKIILKNISFKLEQGQVLGILGQNGIGKTTLLKCLTGIYRWKQGGTYIDGVKMNYSKSLQDVSYVPQAHSLSFPYTVEEVVIMGRARYIGTFSTPTKKDKELVYKILKDLDIYDLKHRKCNELSGGQLQLAYIARALVGEPKLLILDEPESHLDFKNQVLILKLIQNLVNEKGLSCIINTHYPEHALKLADKALLLKNDEYEFGNAKEIINEENLKKYFEIDAKIVTVPYGDMEIESVVALY